MVDISQKIKINKKIIIIYYYILIDNNMNYKSLVVSILLLFAIGFVYDKFKLSIDRNDKKEELDIIKKYLLNESDYYTIDQLSSINKPLLWIHLEYNKNSRMWESFGSRNSEELNQDYLYLTLRSIINKCGNYFHVVMIDDDSFSKLLENWKIDLRLLSNPQKGYFRKLAISKLLCKYGGISIEPSFILLKSLEKMYHKILRENRMVVGEFPNKSIDAHIMNFMPSTNLMGCMKNCKLMSEFSNHLENLYSNDYTENTNCDNLVNKWLLYKINNREIDYINGKFIGTKDKNNKKIDLDILVGNSSLELDDEVFGLYIPKEDLLKRTAYNWFVYLNTQEVLESDTNIGKYLLISNN
tara:strand:+ start:1592 stop:2656 length:1065 start_codon:yes stop_codon:yes gene_type:complete